MSSAKTRAAQEVANSRDKAAESFLSGSTHQKLFAKTFVRNNSPAPATQPRSMKRAREEKSLASPIKSPITGSAKKMKSVTSPSHLDKSHALFKALDATELECEVLPLPSHGVAAADASGAAGCVAKTRQAKAGAAKAGAAKAGAANGKASALKRKK